MKGEGWKYIANIKSRLVEVVLYLYMYMYNT